MPLGVPGVRARRTPTAREGRRSAEEGEAGGEAVDVVVAADRTELAGAEAAGNRDLAERVAHRAGVVVGHTEQAPAASGTGEEERAGRGAAGERAPQVGVRRGRVADLELERLSDVDARADRDRAVGLPCAEYVANQEVAGPELRLPLVDDEADVQSAQELRLILVTEGRRQLLEPFERRPPAERDDVVA